MKIRYVTFIITTIAVLLLFSSCSQHRIVSLMATTPKLVYDKSQTKGLNNYQKDAIYLTETIKQAYPRLGDKLSAEAFEVTVRNDYKPDIIILKEGEKN